MRLPCASLHADATTPRPPHPRPRNRRPHPPASSPQPACVARPTLPSSNRPNRPSRRTGSPARPLAPSLELPRPLLRRLLRPNGQPADSTALPHVTPPRYRDEATDAPRPPLHTRVRSGLGAQPSSSPTTAPSTAAILTPTPRALTRPQPRRPRRRARPPHHRPTLHAHLGQRQTDRRAPTATPTPARVRLRHPPTHAPSPTPRPCPRPTPPTIHPAPSGPLTPPATLNARTPPHPRHTTGPPKQPSATPPHPAIAHAARPGQPARAVSTLVLSPHAGPRATNHGPDPQHNTLQPTSISLLSPHPQPVHPRGPTRLGAIRRPPYAHRSTTPPRALHSGCTDPRRDTASPDLLPQPLAIACHPQARGSPARRPRRPHASHTRRLARRPAYPDARPGEPTPLQPSADSIQQQSGSAGISLRPTRSTAPRPARSSRRFPRIGWWLRL